LVVTKEVSAEVKVEAPFIHPCFGRIGRPMTMAGVGIWRTTFMSVRSGDSWPVWIIPPGVKEKSPKGTGERSMSRSACSTAEAGSLDSTSATTSGTTTWPPKANSPRAYICGGASYLEDGLTWIGRAGARRNLRPALTDIRPPPYDGPQSPGVA
jgi:hypothetical protein